jgi:hypothetical protein
VAVGAAARAVTGTASRAFKGLRGAGKGGILRRTIDSLFPDVLTGTGTSIFLGEVAAVPLVRGARGELFGRAAEEGERLKRATMLQRLAFERQRRLQESMARNMARLAAGAPHLYNQIASGRRLPRGAVVIGGQPRVDLLEQVAMDMALGRFSQQTGQSVDDLLAGITG